MKNTFYLLIFVVLLTNCSKENKPENLLNYITDPNFKDYCQIFDLNEDGILEASEAIQVTYISVNNAGILSLEGVEIFHNLENLDISNEYKNGIMHNRNQVTSLNLHQNPKIRILDCFSNAISSLNISSNIDLEFIQCGDNKLQEIDISQNTKLTEFYCYANNLTSLDVTKNRYLYDLNCEMNQLRELNLSNNPDLVRLMCANNILNEISIANNSNLQFLACEINPNLNYITVWQGFDISNPENSIVYIAKDEHTEFIK